MKEPGMRITAEAGRARPEYRMSAPGLLEMCLKFFEDPENEREFRAWQAQREAAQSGRPARIREA